jgi:D-arabinitol dehydrogenase (NADP+)
VKAVVYEAPRNFAVKEVPTPEPRLGEVRIKIELSGVCGTDLHNHEGNFLAEFPLIPGHEMVGRIDALGADVEKFAVGERVTVNPVLYCKNCEFCLEGRPILCLNREGLGTNGPGFFAEYVVVPTDLVFSVGSLDVDTAVFAEPAACAMHGLHTLEIKGGSKALVLGAGPTGLLLAQLMMTGGAASVTVAASSQFKLDRAKALGVDRTLLMDRADIAKSERDLRAMAPSGFDVVVEATGSTQVGEICVSLTRSGGIVMIYGVTEPSAKMFINPFDVFHREITIKGSFAELNTFPATLAALQTGRVRTDGIITHRYPLEEYGAALEALRSDPTVHKVVLEP